MSAAPHFLPLGIGRLQQPLVTGRTAERLTSRALPVQSAALALIFGGQNRDLRIGFQSKPDGWFAILLRAGETLPAPAAGNAELVLRVTLADGRSAASAISLGAADLAPAPRDITSGSGSFRSFAIAGAPFAISLLFDPVPVLLAGIVIAGNDPARPVAGARISVGALSATSNAAGRFRLGPLPLAEEIGLELRHGTTVTTHRHQIDYRQPVNQTELSTPI